MSRTTNFREHLQTLAAEKSDPVAGFFGPNSLTWQISRERALYLGGMRALLMQVAAPGVARGVAEHSDFREAPLHRGFNTFAAVNALVFGTREDALRAAARTHAIHGRVQGAGYTADDPRLLLWVHATLVDTTMFVHRLVFRGRHARSHAEWVDAYEQTKTFAQLFGVPYSMLPATLEDFDQYMRDTLASDLIEVTPAAIDIKNALLGATPFLKLTAPTNYVAAAAMLPPSLREAYGLRLSLPVRLAFGAIVGSARTITPRLPASVRYVPEYRQAMARVATKR